VDSRALRKNTVETLGLLVERYPNVPIGRIIADALSSTGKSMFDVNYTSDVDLARGLNQLFITYTQFEAAGIKP
jgi:hypothetical protein